MFIKSPPQTYCERTFADNIIEISKDVCVSEFVEKRRAALERYLNRTASHPNLRVDPDFRSAFI